MGKSKLTEEEAAKLTSAEMRSVIRRGEWTTPTPMLCVDNVKANLAIVPKDYAFEFLLFGLRNPQPCAVAEVSEPGDPYLKLLAPGADIRTDWPKYRVFKDGKIIDEPTDITKYWRDDLIAFLIGCFANTTPALLSANVRFRMIGAFSTTIPCVPAGRFHGNMVVTCTIFKSSYDAVRAVQITSRHPHGHGAPVHIGDPASIGIKDLSHPDIFTLLGINHLAHPDMRSRGFTPEPGEVAMFWGCGITPQLVAMQAKVPFMITHWPTHFIITDRLVEEVAML